MEVDGGAEAVAIATERLDELAASAASLSGVVGHYGSRCWPTAG